MGKTFYYLTDRPDTPQVVFGSFYWFAYLVLIPWVLVIALAGMGAELDVGITLMNLYFIGNFAVCCLLFRSFLSSSYGNFKYHKQECFNALLTELGMVPAYYGVLCLLGMIFPPVLESAFTALPVFDCFIINAGVILLPEGVLLTIICIVLLVPVTIGCLYYGVCFAPLWERKPWMGYVGVAAISALPFLFAFDEYVTGVGIGCWLVRLPIHLCACRLYLRTNTVWSAIAFLAIINGIAIIIFRTALFLM